MIPAEYRITLPVPPVINHYWRYWRGRPRLSDAGRTFKQLVAVLAIQADFAPLDYNVEMHVTVYRQRNSGDVDAYLKALLDSLEGYAYHNDKQVCKLVVLKRTDKRHPRCEVIIKPYEGEDDDTR